MYVEYYTLFVKQGVLLSSALKLQALHVHMCVCGFVVHSLRVILLCSLTSIQYHMRYHMDIRIHYHNYGH